MGHRSDQKRPALQCHLRDVNRCLKTSNDQNHEKSFRRFICHVSTRIFVVPFHVLENLLGQAVSLSWINLFKSRGIVCMAQRSGKSVGLLLRLNGFEVVYRSFGIVSLKVKSRHVGVNGSHPVL